MIEGKIKALFKEQYDVNMVVYVYNLNDIEGYDPKTQEQLQQINTAEPQNFLLRDTYLLNWLYFRYVQFQFAKGTNYFESLAQAYNGRAVGRACARSSPSCAATASKNNVDFRMVIFPFVQSLGKDDIFREAGPRSSTSANRKKSPCSICSRSSASTRARSSR